MTMPSGASCVDLRTREDLIKEVSELRMKVWDLEKQLGDQKKNEILKDIERIFDEYCSKEGGSDVLKNDIVDYILEREK